MPIPPTSRLIPAIEPRTILNVRLVHSVRIDPLEHDQVRDQPVEQAVDVALVPHVPRIRRSTRGHIHAFRHTVQPLLVLPLPIVDALGRSAAAVHRDVQAAAVFRPLAGDAVVERHLQLARRQPPRLHLRRPRLPHTTNVIVPQQPLGFPGILAGQRDGCKPLFPHRRPLAGRRSQILLQPSNRLHRRLDVGRRRRLGPRGRPHQFGRVTPGKHSNAMQRDEKQNDRKTSMFHGKSVDPAVFGFFWFFVFSCFPVVLSRTFLCPSDGPWVGTRPAIMASTTGTSTPARAPGGHDRRGTPTGPAPPSCSPPIPIASPRCAWPWSRRPRSP